MFDWLLGKTTEYWMKTEDGGMVKVRPIHARSSTQLGARIGKMLAEIVDDAPYGCRIAFSVGRKNAVWFTGTAEKTI